MDVAIQTGQLLRLAPTQEVQWEEMCADAPSNPGASRNLVMDCRVWHGRLDYDRFEKAVAGVVRRHDALRLVFEDAGLDPRIRLHDDLDAPLARHDVRGPNADEDANTLLWRMSNRPFDPTTEPLWRMVLIRIDDDKHVVAGVFSHVVADGYSCDVFMHDLAAFYAGTSGSMRPAPSLTEIMQRQQERYATTPERLGFWRRQIGRSYERPGIPPDVRPPYVDALRREFRFFDLPKDVVLGVRRTAWQARTTVFVTLLSAYHMTLSLLTGKRETLSVTSTTGRLDALDRAAVFQMASYPYVMLELVDGDSLLDHVKRTHASLERAVSQLVAYTDLAAAANPAFEASRPWPDVNLVDGIFHSWPHGGDDIVADGLLVKQMANPVPPPSENAPGLRCAVPPAGNLPRELAGCRPGMTVSLERDRCVVFFNDQLYSAARIDRLIDGFTWLVGRFATGAGTTAGQAADDFAQTFGVMDPDEEQTQ